MDDCPVIAVAISEFDIDKGNTLSSYWPQRFDWDAIEEKNIADLCLPDGGHLHPEDWTYLFLHRKSQANPPTSNQTSSSTTSSQSSKIRVKKQENGWGQSSGTSPTGGVNPNPLTSSGSHHSPVLNTAAVAELGARTRADSTLAISPRPPASPRKLSASLPEESEDSYSSQKSDGDIIYGLAMFRNKPDKTVRRGAVQQALLLLSRTPIFDVYQDILRHAIQYIMDSSDKNALKTLFEAFKNQWASHNINIFDKTFPVHATTLKQDEFGNASLKELVQRFGVDTMYLWYTMLLQQRILFSGQPAHLVGECCLACPLLVAPLHGFARNISPYVSLTDISPLERKHYICGTTNSILETHTQRYDMMASFSTGIVRKSNAKLSAIDKEFILNVISGMSTKGEKWVRDQFFNYTKNFLDAVSNNSFRCQQHKALGEPFALSQLFEDYLQSQKNSGPSTNTVTTSESLASIQQTLQQAADGKLTLSDAKAKQLLWDLLQKLVDLNTIDELCEKNILASLAPMLDSNSAQVRKYAVATLAQIAISIKGQISLIQHNLIPRVVLMLRDPMPNVASAAAYCLYKISSLFIGVTALVQHRVPKMLLGIICSTDDNLTLKISTAETLLQIHRLDPTCPIVGRDNIRMILRHTSDATFRDVLLLLLDLWGESRLPVKTNDSIEMHLSSLRAGGLDVRTGATSMLLSSVAQDRNLLLQIVAAGGVQTIVRNLTQTPREEPLARLSMAILCLVCDTSMGRSSLLGYNVVATILAEFAVTDFALHLYYVCRFFEVACQYPNTTEVFLENNGLAQMVQIITKYAQKPKLQTITLPCLGALKYLVLLNPLLLSAHPNMIEQIIPIYDIYVQIFKKHYDNLVQVGHEVLRSAMTMQEAVLLSIPLEEREFYQLLHTVLSMWIPEKVESISKLESVPEVEVPIIDEDLRAASEKLVTMLSSHPQNRKSARRVGSPTKLEAISEYDSDGARSSRSASLTTGDDLLAAADLLLADLSSPKTEGSLEKSSINSSLDALDNEIDQLLADFTLDAVRGNRSRSGTQVETEMELAEAVEDLQQSPMAPLLRAVSDVAPSPKLSVAPRYKSSPEIVHEQVTPRIYAGALGGGYGHQNEQATETASKGPPSADFSSHDMWDDIADLTDSILADAPVSSPPPEPEPEATPRSSKRKSLNITSTGSVLLESPRGKSAGREYSGASPSSPRGTDTARTTSPRKINAFRLETVPESSTATGSPPRGRSPSMKRNAKERRSISPTTARMIVDGEEVGSTESPRKSKRRSIQITAGDELLAAVEAELKPLSKQSTGDLIPIPEKPEKPQKPPKLEKIEKQEKQVEKPEKPERPEKRPKRSMSEKVLPTSLINSLSPTGSTNSLSLPPKEEKSKEKEKKKSKDKKQ